MKKAPVNVIRRPEQFTSDDKRVIARYMKFGQTSRVRSLFRRAMRIPESQVPGLLEEVLTDFEPRHRDIRTVLEENFLEMARHVRDLPELSQARRLLIGSYFTMEYSIESAALFNPSIVPHPDQDGMANGQKRFLVSLRATGEGHVSSIVFRRGWVDQHCELHFEAPPRYAQMAKPSPDRRLDKALFCRKFRRTGACNNYIHVLESLSEQFTVSQLRAALATCRQEYGNDIGYKEFSAEMTWLAEANYSVDFPPDVPPTEMVIFPATDVEQHGMEDLRLVRFCDDHDQCHYYGTYTAYDGRKIYPMLLETADFHHFHVSTLSGVYAKNKGMALFPRQIDGQYVMLSRHDGEKLYLLRSPNLYVWNGPAVQLDAPTESWELVQIGNCGSPVETDAGWIVLSHGVGPMRQYHIGAILLDRDDPSRVIGRLREPLLSPNGHEREGYVPNVLYTCGCMIHDGRLIIPYAISDTRTSFATVDVDELVAALKDGRQRPTRRRK
jgi:predicted GH43/DUF377 family glycosyl hydrolase